ncbi:MAG: hypothetical protein JWR34_1790 [Mycobacterium sp.]|nr:hypothetical protein [Mycobacterium sp.]
MTDLRLADPLQVEVVSHSEWWQPWLPFAGSALLFIAAMLTLALTNRAARKRQERELAEKRIENIADRVAARADTLREAVATILAERPATLESQRKLFEATLQHKNEMYDSSVSPHESSGRVMTVRGLHIELCDRLEQEVIRALLLTEDPEIDAALTKVRTIAHNWNEPMKAAQDESRDWDGLMQLGKELTTALDALEKATRKLTAIQFSSPVPLARRRRWYLLWLK